MTGEKGLDIVMEDIQAVLSADLPWHRLSGCTVAVTGASGFIGSYLVRVLLALHSAGRVDAPVTVIGVVRNIDKATTRFADIGSSDCLRLIRSDLAHPQDLDVQADWLIHAASPASPKHYGSDPVGTLAPNVIGTWRLLELAKACRARGFMFVSSSEVYGAVPHCTSLTEEDYGVVDPTAVRSAYAESKRMGENMCVSWMHQYGLPVFIVRPFHTYGPGVDLADGRVFADFAADVVAGRNIRMSSAGTARRAFCYVSDAVRGFFYVMLKGQPGKAYNVANPEGDLSIMELAELMTSLFPERALKVERSAPAAASYLESPYARLLPCVERLVALGWSPAVKPEAGFRRMVESYA
jgi:UDP-glucuronate decarboxylase